jgi:hypothetical protein
MFAAALVMRRHDSDDQQIRLINSIPFSSEEVETFRHRIFANMVDGMRLVRNILDESDVSCSDETWVRGALCAEICLGCTEDDTDTRERLHSSSWTSI